MNYGQQPKRKWMSKHARTFFKNAASSIRDVLKLPTKSQLSSTGYIISWCLQPLLGNLHYFGRHAIQQHACAFLGVLWCFETCSAWWPGGVSKLKSFKLGRRIRRFLIADTDPLMPQRNTGAEKCTARVLILYMLCLPHLRHPEASWGSFHNL